MKVKKQASNRWPVDFYKGGLIRKLPFNPFLVFQGFQL